jgi:hypothetical protein
MAAQQGFVYETNASNALKDLNFVPADFKPAGAGHDQPDLIIMKRGEKAGCELKITDASAGSLVLKYISTDPKSSSWSFFNERNLGENPEKDFIENVAQSIGLFNILNKEWNAVPNKVDKSVASYAWHKEKIKDKSKEELYKEDVANFKELNGSIPTSHIEEYYNEKNTYYVNVGTHGFYMMGSNNPLGLKSVPTFASSANAKWRARVQYKGNGGYQFTFEMSFKMIKKSPFNIAPISKGSVIILKEKIVLPL